MAAKSDRVDFSGADMDIEQLIQEGLQKNKEMQEEADQHAEKSLEESKQNGLDLSLEKIDMFQFQEQDFREVRKNFQQMMQDRF